MDETQAGNSGSWISSVLWRGEVEWRIDGEEALKRIDLIFFRNYVKWLLRLNFHRQHVPKAGEQETPGIHWWEKHFLNCLLLIICIFLTLSYRSRMYNNELSNFICITHTRNIYNPEASSCCVEVWIFVLGKTCHYYNHVAHTGRSV